MCVAKSAKLAFGQKLIGLVEMYDFYIKIEQRIIKGSILATLASIFVIPSWRGRIRGVFLKLGRYNVSSI